MVFDLIISGGGMVGASLAYALKKKSVALIDAASGFHDTDTRLIALNYRSIEFFQTIGLWSLLLPYAEVIQAVHVSQQGRFGAASITAKELNLPYLGYVVPASHINTVLYQALSQQKNISLFRPAFLENFSQNKNSVKCEISCDHKKMILEGKYLIGADGSHSTVRRILQIETHEMDYQQSALVTTTELQRSHHSVAYERFRKHGAIAMLPLKDQRAATIITDKKETISELLRLDEMSFLSYLQKEFGYRLGKFKKIGNRSTYPLHYLQVEKQRENRVLLIGNAAHTLHPIAAQGLNLALYEVAVLSDILDQDDMDLAQIENTILLRKKTSTHYSHQLARFFSMDFFPLNAARQAGLLGLDIMSPLKKYFFSRIIS